MSRTRRTAAFTLIELLVAIGLMIILMGAVAIIFFQSTDLFKTSEARMLIANNARTALDMLARDLAGSLPYDSQAQAFVMWNVPAQPGGPLGTNGEDIPDVVNSFGARDALQFWATTSFQGTVSGVHISYYPAVSRDPEIMTQTGAATGVRSGRNLMVLRRIARRRNGNAWQTDEADLCEYVLSFNVEALVDPDDGQVPPGPQTARFMQLDELPARSAPTFNQVGNPYWTGRLPWSQWWSVSGAAGANPANVPPTTPAGGGSPNVLSTSLDALYPIGCNTPPRAQVNSIRAPMAIRVTMRIVEGAAEKQERLISRVIWIPIQ